jgi:tetratricopeptide (TPR) repeat protein
MGDGRSAAECELQIGLLYRLINRLDEAKRWMICSVERFALQGDARGQARALCELAWLEQLQRQLADATRHVEQALALLADDDPERAMCYRVQGMIAIGQGQLQEAEAYHRKALRGFEEEQDQRKVAWALQNIAYTLREQKKLNEAIPLYQKAQRILKEIGDPYHYAFVTLNLGTAYLYSDEPGTALGCYHDAQTIFSQLHHVLNLANVQNNIGLCYFALHQLEEAENAFVKAIELFETLGERAWLLNAMDGLAMTYLDMERFDKATTILESALAALPKIKDTPNYEYLRHSLHEHLQTAQQSQPLSLRSNG